MTRMPFAPQDKILRTYTEPEIASLLRELHERGEPFGIRWGSATVDGTTVHLGDTSLAIFLNLLELLREASRK
ncbi:hypothetical protein ABZW10_00275 [Kitasatospora sp. NPDC004723]|uniref:hypothetical protein n=1 Tax=Kitasatospora sp. NPDC004723 TaxID=3154288 RepID=UPI0033A84A56